jgi:MFS superfamily sulfate permease-like transporter
VLWRVFTHSVRFGLGSLADISLCVLPDNSITIGPVAVMSLLTGQIITEVVKEHPKLVPHEIASALAVLCGAFVFVLGILRLGYVLIHVVHI